MSFQKPLLHVMYSSTSGKNAIQKKVPHLMVEPHAGSPLGPVARCTEVSGNGFSHGSIPGMSLALASIVIIIFLYLLTISNINAVAGVVPDSRPTTVGEAALFRMIFVGVTSRTRTSNGTEIPLEFPTEIGQLFYALVVLTNDYGALLEIKEIGDPVD